MLNGILSSAISGLRVNGQRVAAAADNIANVSTQDYKRVEIQAKSISSGQTSSFQYAPGGVLATNRRVIDAGLGLGSLNNSTDLGRAFVNLMNAKTAYSAGAKVVRTAEDMSQSLLDVKA